MGLFGADDNLSVYQELIDSYSEPHRHYHTVEHIADCLTRFDEVQAHAESIEEVEIALWFHDAIYKPTSSKNEAESADWAIDFLRRIEAPRDRCDRVYRHILATRHEAAPADPDAALLVDIDLSILGREREEYDRFEKNVRKEYRWVPWPLYRRKRREILESFLNRPNIYSGDYFRGKYEETARKNLERAIGALS